MFGEKALELIKELHRSKGGNVTTYNEDIVRQVLDEMRALFEQNQADVNAAMDGEQHLYPAIQIRHAALERNKRCLLSYLYSRLQLIRQMRWDFGSVLPADVKFCLTEQEDVCSGAPRRAQVNKSFKVLVKHTCSIPGLKDTQMGRQAIQVKWFGTYNKMLATYMRSIGEHGGLDLTQDIRPPKTLYIEVRCLADHGEFETNEGIVISLKKNSQHFLLRSECEHLIRQGILEHIVH